MSYALSAMGREAASMLIRHPRPDEALDGLWPAYGKFAWNLEQVYVVEVDGQLVGGALIWDAGHEMVHLDELTVIEGFQREGIATALCLRIREDLVARGRKVLLGWTRREWFEQFAKRYGVHTGGPLTLLWWPL